MMKSDCSRLELVVAIGSAVGTVPFFTGCALLRGGAQHPRYRPSSQELKGTELSLPRARLESLAPGQVLQIKLEKYEDLLVTPKPGRGYYVVSGVCTHRGCIVGWNPAGPEWKCPCHQSRYAPDGRVLEGPAQKPLIAPAVRATRDSLVIDLSSMKKA